MACVCVCCCFVPEAECVTPTPWRISQAVGRPNMWVYCLISNRVRTANPLTDCLHVGHPMFIIKSVGEYVLVRIVGIWTYLHVPAYEYD